MTEQLMNSNSWTGPQQLTEHDQGAKGGGQLPGEDPGRVSMQFRECFVDEQLRRAQVEKCI